MKNQSGGPRAVVASALILVLAATLSMHLPKRLHAGEVRIGLWRLAVGDTSRPDSILRDSTGRDSTGHDTTSRDTFPRPGKAQR